MDILKIKQNSEVMHLPEETYEKPILHECWKSNANLNSLIYLLKACFHMASTTLA